MAVYKLVLVSDGMAYVAGHGPVGADGTSICGKLGENLQKEEGYEAARRTGLRMLASLRDEFGSLDKIKRLVKTLGFVNATPDFKDHPAVINGFSEVMAMCSGPTPASRLQRHRRGSLPGGWAVEIEAILSWVIATLQHQYQRNQLRPFIAYRRNRLWPATPKYTARTYPRPRFKIG
jgi:enamine deaminase RidA (YjgF/YER057c/UK114 family)